MTRLLLNTLFINSPGAFGRLEGDTIRVEVDGEKVLQVPLLHLAAIVLFERASLSPQLMMRCADEGREITFLDYAGRFKCRVEGPVSGNVLLRKAQYDAQASEALTMEIARPIVAVKIKNARQTLLRGAREVKDADSITMLKVQAALMAAQLETLPEMQTLDGIRGIEGQAAACYFRAFGCLISREKSEFAFTVRTRRPPRDRVNALLSFVYALLTNDCVAAVAGVGLDPQFGFLHCLRPGRPALALDLMEEFRSSFADRLVLTLINRRQIQPDDFESRPGESVMLTDKGRKTVLTAYQERKKEEAAHPLLKTTTPIGLVFHLQARLLARHLRGDLPSYLPFVSR